MRRHPGPVKAPVLAHAPCVADAPGLIVMANPRRTTACRGPPPLAWGGRFALNIATIAANREDDKCEDFLVR
ncbi:hypothetical protein SAMN05444678_109174 [Sphingomonas sp. YR710]|jgi:hypothetical protein|nr:hypothetical protein SAMN05444678_109174 [Sphingomonas sp. YR710]